MRKITVLVLIFITIGFTNQICAQSGDLKLVDWKPVSQLVVKETKIEKAKYPVIDIHNHLGKLENTQKYLDEMDKAGVWKCVSLDANSKDDFYLEHLKTSQRVSRDRFLLFFRPDFSRIEEENFGENEAKRLEEAVKMGCRGLKIAKTLGLGYKDKSGKFIAVDDPRIDPIWEKCGDLGIPVEIPDFRRIHAANTSGLWPQGYRYAAGAHCTVSGLAPAGQRRARGFLPHEPWPALPFRQ